MPYGVFFRKARVCRAFAFVEEFRRHDRDAGQGSSVATSNGISARIPEMRDAREIFSRLPELGGADPKYACDFRHVKGSERIPAMSPNPFAPARRLL